MATGFLLSFLENADSSTASFAKIASTFGSFEVSELTERFTERWDRIEVGRQNELLAFEVTKQFPTNYSTMYHDHGLTQHYIGATT